MTRKAQNWYLRGKQEQGFLYTNIKKTLSVLGNPLSLIETGANIISIPVFQHSILAFACGSGFRYVGNRRNHS